MSRESLGMRCVAHMAVSRIFACRDPNSNEEAQIGNRLMHVNTVGLMLLLHARQVTKSAAALNAMMSPRISDDGSPSTDATEAPAGPKLPPITTLLEFVAWVVQTGQALSPKALEDWSKGRGGYLIDELSAVREAFTRVQVG